MAEFRPLDVITPPQRFLRSAHLERDFEDAGALHSYVVTLSLREALDRVAEGLEPDSNYRAWRVTGDYGSGKSSFGLALARLVSPDLGEMHPVLAEIRGSLPEGGLLPVLVTGSRDRMSVAVVRGLRRALERERTGGRTPQVLKDADTALARAQGGAPPEETDGAALDLLRGATDYVVRSGRGRGVMLILDELGKFLEHAALDPASQDVYFLQRLGEAAARSGARPLVVIGLLHQGFYAYAENLGQGAQKEWEKVSGRFEELLFNHPLEHTAELVAGALGVRTERLPKGVAEAARIAMERSIELGWYGPVPAREKLLGLAPALYPLHPSVLPSLVRVLGRFGQNERSVFSFLLSHEPGGLQAFAARKFDAHLSLRRGFYRLPHLFDYVRSTLGLRLGAQSYRSHWPEISATVDAVRVDDPVALDVVKTVGILNLLNAHDLLATSDAIRAAVADEAEVDAAIDSLRNGRMVLHDRGPKGGLALWPHTSVNLERAIETARLALGPLGAVAPHLERYLSTRPLVARRHYIETGNLRHFEVRYASVSDLSDALRRSTPSDGMLLVALAESPSDREEAVLLVRQHTSLAGPATVVLVPRPLAGLAGEVDEVRRWEWVAENTPELNHDRYAAEEVGRQLEEARGVLAERLRDRVGLHSGAAASGTRWFRDGKEVEPSTGLGVLRFLSDICDQVYVDAPCIHNELVNRASLSSAAAGARMRLIERMLERASEPMLGLPEKTAPPEKSMYLSVLHEGRIHMKGADGWSVRVPDPADDSSRVRPALLGIRRTLEEAPDGRAPVVQIYNVLRRPPYGVREGLLPLLLAIFVRAHEADVALYERGTFVRHLGGSEFLRVIKAPEIFDVQFYPIAGVRTELFERLLEILGRDGPVNRSARLLDVVTQLATFAADLPDYTIETRALSARARAVRDALLESREPATLLFRSLPEACGIEPFPKDGPIDESCVRSFVSTLRSGLEELRAAYPELVGRLRSEVISSFGYPLGQSDVRRVLGERAMGVLQSVLEPQLRAFCTRLADDGLSEDEWLEAIASAVRERPPTRWRDEDEARYREEIHILSNRFRHVESLAFGPGGAVLGRGRAVRVSITRPDGTEVQEVVHTDQAAEEHIAKLETKIGAILAKAPRSVGLAAASRAVLKRILADSGPEA